MRQTQHQADSDQHLTVASDAAGAVTLEGLAGLECKLGTWTERIQAEHLAWSAPGVTAVDNRLTIRM